MYCWSIYCHTLDYIIGGYVVELTIGTRSNYGRKFTNPCIHVYIESLLCITYYYNNA